MKSYEILLKDHERGAVVLAKTPILSNTGVSWVIRGNTQIHNSTSTSTSTSAKRLKTPEAWKTTTWMICATKNRVQWENKLFTKRNAIYPIQPIAVQHARLLDLCVLFIHIRWQYGGSNGSEEHDLFSTLQWSLMDGERRVMWTHTMVDFICDCVLVTDFITSMWFLWISTEWSASRPKWAPLPLTLAS